MDGVNELAASERGDALVRSRLHPQDPEAGTNAKPSVGVAIAITMPTAIARHLALLELHCSDVAVATA